MSCSRFCKMLVFLLIEKDHLLTFLSMFTSVLIQKMTTVKSPFWPMIGQFMHFLFRCTILLSIFYHSKMWTFLEHISTLTENIRVALQAIPDSEKQKVCDAFLPQCRTTFQEKQTPVIRTTSRSIEYVTSDGGELKPG